MQLAEYKDELKCRNGHQLKPLEDVPSTFLTCDFCGEDFLMDKTSYGCAECNHDACYRCIKDLPQSRGRGSAAAAPASAPVSAPASAREAERPSPPQAEHPSPPRRPQPKSPKSNRVRTEMPEDSDGWVQLREYMREHGLTPKVVLKRLRNAKLGRPRTASPTQRRRSRSPSPVSDDTDREDAESSDDEDPCATVPSEPDDVPQIMKEHQSYNCWYEPTREIKKILKARRQQEGGEELIAHVLDAALLWALKFKRTRTTLRGLCAFRLERFASVARVVKLLETQCYTPSNTLYIKDKLNVSWDKLYRTSQRLMYVRDEEGNLQRLELGRAPVWGTGTRLTEELARCVPAFGKPHVPAAISLSRANDHAMDRRCYGIKGPRTIRAPSVIKDHHSIDRVAHTGMVLHLSPGGDRSVTHEQYARYR